VITFDVPSNVSGVAVEGIRLTFEGGKVVGAQADKGGDLLLAQLESDEGARYLGELGIGTNPHITVPTRSILFDEKMAGTVHLALGQSYPETGGVNRSAIHWDMVCDLRRGGRIYLDGELFQENGRFVGQ
jgi:aminopeptidase